MPLRGSAAYAIVIVLTASFLIGSMFLTVIDPVLQAMFDSAFWTADIQILKDLLNWGVSIGTYLAFFILLGYLSRAWIWTRRAG